MPNRRAELGWAEEPRNWGEEEIGEMPDVKGTTEDVVVEKAAPASGADWRLALVLVASAFGVLLMALADNAGRNSASSAYALFWIGLVIIFSPIAVYVFRPQTSRNERVLLLASFGSSSLPGQGP